ncbi:MAG: AAA family ATPase [Succinivibrionaceae bacterium]|nr:AAA family ATPase [Succinivibrionaceae bacterium]
MKLLPDAISDFEGIIKNNYVYIDKTEFIKKYEDTGARVSLFLHPRRFGKTMFTEILHYYYDRAQASLADELLANTWIASHPTRLKNSYGVLKFDFSRVRNIGGIEDTMDFFMSQVTAGICDFYNRYPEFVLTETGDKKENVSVNDVNNFYGDRNIFTSPAKIITHFFNDFASRGSGLKLMVIIDEYDNFTNDILSRDPEMFADIARKEGELGAFYNALRNFNQRKIAERIFVTGVLPVTMDTAVSGFVSSKLSQIPELNCMAGFTDAEVETLVRETIDLEKSPFSPGQLRDLMKIRFDGYRFSSFAGETVYNAALCISFVSSFLAKRCMSVPRFNVSSATDIDYQKLAGYLKLMKDEDRDELIDAILNKHLIPVVFPGTLKISSDRPLLNFHEGVAILYHLGFFTMASLDEIRLQHGDPAGDYLKVPNEYFSLLFSKFYFQSRNVPWSDFEGNCDLRSLAVKNDLSAFMKFLKGISQAFVNTDNTKQGEAQVALAAYVALSLNTGTAFRLIREYPVRHGGKYVMSDVPELDINSSENVSGESLRVNLKAGRADLVALNVSGGPNYVFEFKYARDTSSRDETNEKIRSELFEQARQQLELYVTDDELGKLTELHRYVVMYTYGELSMKEV